MKPLFIRCSLSLALSLCLSNAFAQQAPENLEDVPQDVPLNMITSPSVSPSSAVMSSAPAEMSQNLRSFAKELIKLDRPALEVSAKPTQEEWMQILIARGWWTVDQTWNEESWSEAVKKVQQAYGLAEDGKPGSQLLGSISASDRSVAMALMAWADHVDEAVQKARAAGHRKIIIVNLPSYTLHAIDLTTGNSVVESRVIVGTAAHKTPRFVTNIINLKLNPDWTPTARMKRSGKRYVPAGPRSPLGKVRFSTDNNISIYLHHTNEENLFELGNRSKSSGCIRVEKWQDVAAFVAETTQTEIEEWVSNGKTRFVKVEKVPVWMSYSIVDLVGSGAGVYPDIYGEGNKAIGKAALTDQPQQPIIVPEF